MPMLDFKRFYESRKHQGEAPCGFIFPGELSICVKKDGYSLVIANMQWVDTDLERLARILWSTFYLGEVERDVTLSQDDGTLDDFVVGYCDARGVECDGDLFGVLFTGQDSWTLEEAETLVERGVKTTVRATANH